MQKTHTPYLELCINIEVALQTSHRLSEKDILQVCIQCIDLQTPVEYAL